jgi:hypothetical protein
MSILYTPKNLKLDTTESSTSASYLDVSLNIDAGGKLTIKLYDKRDDFSFIIVICSNIPLSPAYLNWFDMQGPAQHMISFWVEVDYWQTSWCHRDFYKLYGRYNDLINNYKLSLSHMLSDIFHTYS